MTLQHRQQFINIIGKNSVLSDQQSLNTYGKDWTTYPSANPSLILLPHNTQEVSKVLAYCSLNRLAVVPSGGRTGLAGGATAENQQIVVSLSKMNNVLTIDSTAMSAEVEAGVTTQQLQDAAYNKGTLFAIDLAAKGSSQIGGNLATNAGGLKFIKYGGTREQVLGLEAVLADGSILELNNCLYKNNSGYDLKQLFIGSEGTLGVITKATLRLHPLIKDTLTAIIPVQKFKDILLMLQHCYHKNLNLQAFEFFTHHTAELVYQYHPQLKLPFDNTYNFYILFEVANTNTDVFNTFLEECFNLNLIQDAIPASNNAEKTRLWQLRENITECIANLPFVHKNDLSLPITQLEKFTTQAHLISKKYPQIKIFSFGHVGDGNIHLNYTATQSTKEEFKKTVTALEAEIFALVFTCNGSISAEHGIGLLKKAALRTQVSSQHMDLMRQIKKVFDPQNIMNPGKIFDECKK